MSNHRTAKICLTALIIVLICVNVSRQVSSSAGLNDQSIDEYLAQQFDWVIHVNVEEVDHYLKYPGSTLRPLTRVSLECSTFERGTKDDIVKSGRRRHEERWYHHGLPIGLRRRTQWDIPEGKVGAIFVENIGDKHEQSLALANSLVSLAIDLQLKRNDLSMVMVPNEQYESVASSLTHYSFYPTEDVSEGRQMSIYLCGYPLGKEEYFFLRH